MKIPQKRVVKKLVILAVVITLAVLIAQVKFTVVTGIKNGEFITAHYKIEEENFSHPRLKMLRERENLDKIIASGKTQFEKIILLRRWVSQQWKPSNNFYYPPWDAIEILDLARKYNNFGFCGQYAIVFLQSCQSLGIHARYVDLDGHFVTAVWSDEYNRWVIMDPSNDIHFEKDGIPLKGRELCHFYWSDDIKNIYKINSDGIKTPVKKEDLAPYKKYSIILRTNHLSDPITILQGTALRRLTIQDDYHTYPLMGGKETVGYSDKFLAWKEKDATEFFSDKTYTDDPDDFRHVYNQTIMFLASRNDETEMIKIVLLGGNSPTSKTFQININNQGWETCEKAMIVYKLNPGLNRISARIVTNFGWECQESHINIFYKARWF